MISLALSNAWCFAACSLQPCRPTPGQPASHCSHEKTPRETPPVCAHGVQADEARPVLTAPLENIAWLQLALPEFEARQSIAFASAELPSAAVTDLSPPAVLRI